jgi:hypothetical protein
VAVEYEIENNGLLLGEESSDYDGVDVVVVGIGIG